ncbi:hypothetical protein [Blautia segnis]|uniref:Uncharacterized protein n=1 Tax=Blautia segnis TaxID=2763030 RepID=A0A8I0ADK7_9FIRM|nr:hypothetical protein [Blautia segnis]MBC5651088.1 hypothetical protein [Blautia segnis]
MFGKIGYVLRCGFDFLLITLGVLYISGPKSMGGTGINGLIGFLIWCAMICIDFKVSHLLGVGATYVIYFTFYIIKYGVTESIIYMIIAFLIIAFVIWGIHKLQS